MNGNPMKRQFGFEMIFLFIYAVKCHITNLLYDDEVEFPSVQKCQSSFSRRFWVADRADGYQRHIDCHHCFRSSKRHSADSR